MNSHFVLAVVLWCVIASIHGRDWDESANQFRPSHEERDGIHAAHRRTDQYRSIETQLFNQLLQHLRLLLVGYSLASRLPKFCTLSRISSFNSLQFHNLPGKSIAIVRYPPAANVCIVRFSNQFAEVNDCP